MTVVLTDLPAGHRFDSIRFTIDPERVRAYREATADPLTIYDEAAVVPPMAVAAFALGALLEHVSLPPGTLHGSETLQFRGPVPTGATVECRASLSQRSNRSGWIVSVIDSEIVLNGAGVGTTRATVLSPQA